MSALDETKNRSNKGVQFRSLFFGVLLADFCNVFSTFMVWLEHLFGLKDTSQLRMDMSGAVATFWEAVSSFSFPFEGFGGMSVTKSGMVVIVTGPSESSTTVLKRTQHSS